MTCDYVQDLLSAYVDGMATSREKTAVKNHLAGCSQCRDELTALEDMVMTLRSLGPVEPPAGLSNTIKARIRNERAVAKRKRLAMGWLPVGAAAAALFVWWMAGIGQSGVPAPKVVEHTSGQMIAEGLLPEGETLPGVPEGEQETSANGIDSTVAAENEETGEGLSPASPDRVDNSSPDGEVSKSSSEGSENGARGNQGETASGAEKDIATPPPSGSGSGTQNSVGEGGQSPDSSPSVTGQPRQGTGEETDPGNQPGTSPSYQVAEVGNGSGSKSVSKTSLQGEAYFQTNNRGDVIKSLTSITGQAGGQVTVKTEGPLDVEIKVPAAGAGVFLEQLKKIAGYKTAWVWQEDMAGRLIEAEKRLDALKEQIDKTEHEVKEAPAGGTGLPAEEELEALRQEVALQAQLVGELKELMEWTQIKVVFEEEVVTP